MDGIKEKDAECAMQRWQDIGLNDAMAVVFAGSSYGHVRTIY